MLSGWQPAIELLRIGRNKMLRCKLKRFGSSAALTLPQQPLKGPIEAHRAVAMQQAWPGHAKTGMTRGYAPARLR
jgi:hypothetical protein